MRPRIRVATLEEVVRYGSHEALRAHGLLPPIAGAAGLAIDASTPPFLTQVAFGGAAVASLTTASFTPPAGALLIVPFGNSANTTLQTAPTNTGGTVAWDATAKVTEAANGCASSIWLGTVTVSASMTVTLHKAATATNWTGGVAVVTGQAATQNGATGVNTSANGLPSQSVTTLGANSLILGSIVNFTNGTLPTVPANQSTTFGSRVFTNADAANAAIWAQYLTGINLAAGATATINDTAPSVAYSLTMIEILAAPSIRPMRVVGQAMMRAATR